MARDPQEVDPDLDSLTFAQLDELGMPGKVADVLDEWALRRFGVSTHKQHGVGLFLDLLAAEGYRVESIDPGPPIDELLPVPPSVGGES